MMSDRPHFNSDEAFAERVARVARAPEHFGNDFERSLVDALRSERPLKRKLVPRSRTLMPGWWSTPMTLRLSPVAGLALAASLATIAVLGTVRVTSTGSGPAPQIAAQTVHDTVTLVRFVFVGHAKSVSLVGDFNGWGVESTPLQATGSNDAWAASVSVPNGRHEYAFVVDGRRWMADPFAPSTSDEFDTNSSIITVGS